MQGSLIPVRPGTIYILRNAAYRETVVKIGHTARTAEMRAAELSSPTGVATPFEVLYEESVADCERAEKIIHTKLANSRVSKSREFFNIPLKQAVRAVFETCLRVNAEYLRERSRLAIWIKSDASYGTKLGDLLMSAKPGTTAVRLILQRPGSHAEMQLSNTLLVACTPEFLTDLQRQDWVKDVQVYVPTEG